MWQLATPAEQKDFVPDFDYVLLDFNWTEDIAQWLSANNSTWLHLNSLPKELKEQIKSSIPAAMILEWKFFDIRISLLDIMKYLWINEYKIITDNQKRNLDKLKDDWVIYVWTINDFRDLNIRDINSSFGSNEISRSTFLGRYDLPYVLFYNKKEDWILWLDWILWTLKSRFWNALWINSITK